MATKLEWYRNRHEIIMRLISLGNSIRLHPKKVADPIKLNKVGKAIEELATCLRYLEKNRANGDIKKVPFENWYEAVMVYFED